MIQTLVYWYGLVTWWKRSRNRDRDRDKNNNDKTMRSLGDEDKSVIIPNSVLVQKCARAQRKLKPTGAVERKAS
jgi:hypothetical protein